MKKVDKEGKQAFQMSKNVYKFLSKIKFKGNLKDCFHGEGKCSEN